MTERIHSPFQPKQSPSNYLSILTCYCFTEMDFIGLYRENAIAIESEASDSLTSIDQSVRKVTCIVTYA